MYDLREKGGKVALTSPKWQNKTFRVKCVCVYV